MTQTSSTTSPCALVVDDDGMVRMAAVDILEEAGFTTFEAESGDRALLVLEEHHACVTLLFTDVQMPPGELNGFDLARECSKNWPHIGIIVASGMIEPGPEDIPDGARFVRKPFSADVVYNHLGEILADGRKPEPLQKRSV